MSSWRRSSGRWPTCCCGSRTRRTRTFRSAVRRRTRPSARGVKRGSGQRTAGSGGRTGSWPRRWTSSTTPRRQGGRLRLPGLQGGRFRPPAGAHRLVHGHPDRQLGVHRDLAARRGQRGQRPRHRSDSGQGGPDVRRPARRPLPGPDGGGAGHEPPPRRDPPRPTSCRSGTARTRPASGARRVPRARTPVASSGSTSSTRSRWCSSSGRTRRRTHSSG